MTRVGLFLAAEPFDGGAFQYSLSVLHALTDDAPPDLTTVVVTTNDSWNEFLEPLPVKRIDLTPGTIGRMLLTCVKFGVIPLGLWRRIAGKFNAPTSVLLQLECDAWIFPSQDAWSYFFPVPAIVSIFDLMHRYERQFPEVSRGFKYQRRERHYKKICKSAIGVLADSSVGKQQIEASYAVAPNRVHVLPFIPPPYVGGDESNEVDILDLPNKYFFYPAQFWMHKNHVRLIRAVAALVERCPDVFLILVGSKKNNYGRVRELIDELNLSQRVKILGYVTNQQIVDLYRNARALIMPTFFGPTNIPPLEAMQLGCPVAVSDIYGMPEQLNEAGLLFDPNAIEEITEVMFRLWTDDELCEELVMKGRQRNKEWTQLEFSAQLHTTIRQAISDTTHSGQG